MILCDRSGDVLISCDIARARISFVTHSRSQSFGPFGQRRGSTDQKDRSSGNENVVAELKAAAKV